MFFLLFPSITAKVAENLAEKIPGLVNKRTQVTHKKEVFTAAYPILLVVLWLHLYMYKCKCTSRENKYDEFELITSAESPYKIIHWMLVIH